MAKVKVKLFLAITVLVLSVLVVSIPIFSYAPTTQDVEVIDYASAHIKDLGNVWHLWNEHDDYYIDSEGIQLSNHFLDYWTHNVWVLWVVDSPSYNEMFSSDGLGWTWTSGGDNSTYVFLNGTASISDKGYSADVGVRYYLAEDYRRINITLWITNTGKAVDELAFGWRVDDIKIDNTTSNDWMWIPDSTEENKDFDLSNSTLDVSYSQDNMSSREYSLYDNSSWVRCDFWWDTYFWKNGEQQNMNYALSVEAEDGQVNAPNLLKIPLGGGVKGDWAYSNFWWHDPSPTSYTASLRVFDTNESGDRSTHTQVGSTISESGLVFGSTNTLNSGNSVATLTADYSTDIPSSNEDTEDWVYGWDTSENKKVAQSFTLALSQSISEITLYIKRQGSGRQAIVQIYGDDNGLPDDANPIGGSSVILDAGNTGDYSWVDFPLSSPASLSANTQYWIVFKDDSTTDYSNFYLWGIENSDVAGISAVFFGTWSSEALYDQFYKLLSTTGTVYRAVLQLKPAGDLWKWAPDGAGASTFSMVNSTYDAFATSASAKKDFLVTTTYVTDDGSSEDVMCWQESSTEHNGLGSPTANDKEYGMIASEAVDAYEDGTRHWDLVTDTITQDYWIYVEFWFTVENTFTTSDEPEIHFWCDAEGGHPDLVGLRWKFAITTAGENVAPEIKELRLSATGDNNNITSINVYTYYDWGVNVTDTDTMDDLANVTVRIENNPGNEIDADSPTYTETSEYWFRYDDGTGNWEWYSGSSWTTTSDWITPGSCVKPSSSATNGYFEFYVRLSKIASYSTQWDFSALVYDEAGENDTAKFAGITVNQYSEITIITTTHSWSNATTGTNDNLIEEGSITVNVTANHVYDLEAKANASYLVSAESYQIAVGNITIHKDTLGSSISLTTTWTDIGGLTSLAAGADQQSSFKLWLDVPSDAVAWTDYQYKCEVRVNAS